MEHGSARLLNRSATAYADRARFLLRRLPTRSDPRAPASRGGSCHRATLGLWPPPVVDRELSGRPCLRVQGRAAWMRFDGALAEVSPVVRRRLTAPVASVRPPGYSANTCSLAYHPCSLTASAVRQRSSRRSPSSTITSPLPGRRSPRAWTARASRSSAPRRRSLRRAPARSNTARYGPPCPLHASPTHTGARSSSGRPGGDRVPPWPRSNTA